MKNNILVLVIGIIAAMALVIFLVAKNLKDRKQLNPDEPDAIQETKMDKERERDKV